MRLQRVERLLSRMQKGLGPDVFWDARFIDRLFSQDLKDLREAQADRRWRKDALSVLGQEVARLHVALGMNEAKRETIADTKPEESQPEVVEAPQ